jgi:hypothetical protein
MNQKIELKCKVEKVVIANGKDAQMVITFPQSMASNIPLGHVVVSMQTLQKAMFGSANTDNDVADTKVANVRAKSKK